MEKFLISGLPITGDANGFALVLTHVDCGHSFLAGYSGVAPTLDQVFNWALKHLCGDGKWRRIGADELARL